MVTAMAADALVTKGARASAAMVLTYFFRYIPVSAQVVSTLTELLISQEILLAILNDIIWSTRHYKESLLFKDTTDKYNSVWSPPVKCMLMASTTALLGHLQVQWWPWPAPQGVSACSVVSQNWWSGTARITAHFVNGNASTSVLVNPWPFIYLVWVLSNQDFLKLTDTQLPMSRKKWARPVKFVSGQLKS